MPAEPCVPVSIIPSLAAQLGVEAKALLAVIQVESAGIGHGLVNGWPLIRLEIHHLWRMVPLSKRTLVDDQFNVAGRVVPLESTERISPTPGSQPWLGHQFLEGGIWKALHQPAGQALEWRAYNVACEIDAITAVQATSWGLGQILGEYWNQLKFPSPESFAMWQMTEDHQLETMTRYIAASPQMLHALQQKDWKTFARFYNGIGKVDDYAAKLLAAYGHAI